MIIRTPKILLGPIPIGKNQSKSTDVHISMEKSDQEDFKEGDRKTLPGSLSDNFPTDLR